MATRSFLLTLLLVLTSVSLAWAQGREVTGTVTDATNGFALPGVNIVIQGTTNGTTTGLDGEYSLRVPGNDAVLVYSFVGYLSQQITVGTQSVINVALREDVALLEDIVVVGYGTQRRGDVTGSVASFDVQEANRGVVTSPTQLIQGRVAGVNITSNDGEPGAGLNIRIRGGTSISASNEPLYVIDGVPIDNAATTPGGANVSTGAARNPLNLINPSDIESISILKDASATAIYGSRGANGVVLITTKRGVQDRVSVDYDGFVAAASPYSQLEVLDGDEYRSFIEEQVSAGRLPSSRLSDLGSANTNWEEEITQTGVTHSHNLSFAGGTERTQYRASVSYLDQEGSVISSGLQRTTARLNVDQQAFDGRLKLAMNLSSSYTDDDFLPAEETGGFEGGLFINAYSFNPTRPVENADGTFFELGTGRQGVRNPVALADQILDFAKTTRSLGNLSATLELTKGLSLQTNFGLDRTQSSRRLYFPKASPVGAEFGGQAIQRSRERSSSTFQSYLTYDGKFSGKHSLNLLGGYEFNEYLVEEFGVEARNYVTDVLEFNAIEAGVVNQSGSFSDKGKNRLISFFSRANYNLSEKYYLTGVLRYDGSSRFGENNKWAVFPAVSAAWRISSESFMRSQDFISDLRLKVGYGVTGSQEIANYLSLQQLAADPGNRAVLGGQVVTGVAPANFANPDLQWEETSSFNVGVDYAFRNGKFSGTLEYYNKQTSKLLLEVPVPAPAVVPTRIENIGEVKNQGVEFSLDALALDKKDMFLQVGIVFATNQNEVVSTGGREIFTGSVSGRGQSDTFSQIIREGESLGTFFGPVFTGVDANGAQQFEDIDGDGILETSGDDRAIIGNAQPDFTYGFRTSLTWKKLDASFFIRGEQGRDVFNNTALVYQTKSAALQNQNFLKDALDDPDALSEAAKFSSRWIEDGSFLRLDNVTLAYTLGAEQLSSQLRNARIYLSMQNLLVLTGYSGYDPEVQTNAGLASLGVDYLNYPKPRTFTLGVSLGF
jgi:iron complex outermembrane receptor protein